MMKTKTKEKIINSQEGKEPENGSLKASMKNEIFTPLGKCDK